MPDRRPRNRNPAVHVVDTATLRERRPSCRQVSLWAYWSSLPACGPITSSSARSRAVSEASRGHRLEGRPQRGGRGHPRRARARPGRPAHRQGKVGAMLRVTGMWAAIGEVIAGLMLADLLTHPAGTNALAGGINSLEKQTGNQLLGVKA